MWKEYVKKKHHNEWPESIMNFKGIKGLEDWKGFEADRENLKENKESMFEEGKWDIY